MNAEDLIRAGIQAAVRKPLMNPDPVVSLRLAGLLQMDYKGNFRAVDIKSQYRLRSAFHAPKSFRQYLEPLFKHESIRRKAGTTGSRLGGHRLN
jgi:hypothetical protein